MALQTLPAEGEATAHPIISGLETQGGWFLLLVKTFTKLLYSCRARGVCITLAKPGGRKGCEVSK